MMLIPFNLERCIAGEDVITRGGNDYVFGAYNGKMAWPIIGWIGGFSVSHMEDGRRCKDNRNSAEDLFMKPEKITRWILVNRNIGFDTKEDIVDYMQRDYVKNSKVFTQDNSAIIKMEFFPGDGHDA